MSKYIIFGEELIEQNAIDQFNIVMSQDWVINGALMPDSHHGYTLPIGGVVAVEDRIVPAFVGYDLGCGMSTIKTIFKRDDLTDNIRETIYKNIYKEVPVGLGINRKAPANTSYDLNNFKYTKTFEHVFKKSGLYDLGSLGHGNHFIEIGYDEEESIWITIHSGSRGVGHAIATHYMKLASGNGKAREGCYPLLVNSEDGQNYINDLHCCLEFAKENRFLLLTAVSQVLDKVINRKTRSRITEACDLDTLINRNHNHAEFKDGLWIHRKGATHAEKDMLGVIPGSMGTGCFIVKGKGNQDSLCSSSHGAGRRFSRKEAQETISMEDFKNNMTGITATITGKTVDESPLAYKDIFKVLELQKDLIEIVSHIKPLINIKG